MAKTKRSKNETFRCMICHEAHRRGTYVEVRQGPLAETGCQVKTCVDPKCIVAAALGEFNPSKRKPA